LSQWFELFMPPDQGTIFKFRDLARSEEALSCLCLLSLLLNVHDSL